MNSLVEVGVFLINTIFGIYLSILGIRLILAWERANYFNPIIRFIITLTQPLVSPVRRFLPNIGKLETATLLWLLVLTMLKFILLVSITGQTLNFLVLPITAVLITIVLLIQIFFYSILIFAILSWVHAPTTPIMQVLAQLSAPILRPLQKIIPLVSGFDITPLVALILLQVLLIIL